MIKGLIITALLLILSECFGIPLPGVDVHSSQTLQTHPVSSTDIGKTPFQPSFRDIVPTINQTVLQHLQAIATDKKLTTTTKNPLEMLLDKVYGSGNWRHLLDESQDQISTTSLPVLIESASKPAPPSRPPFLSFWSNDISASQFRNDLDAQRTTSKPTQHSVNENPYNEFRSKFMMKIVGSQRHGSENNSQSSAEQPNHTQSPQWPPVSVDAGTPLMFLKDQGQGITTHAPVLATQTVNLAGQGANLFSPGQLNPGINGGGQTFAGNGYQIFDPNKINDEQHMYSPSLAFSNFLTQTGSNPLNSQMPVAYDADAVNERYMAENIDRLNPAIPNLGLARQSLNNEQQYGYRFNAYRGAQPQIFDANALNQALLESSRSYQQHPGSPAMFMPGSGSQTETSQTPKQPSAHTAETANQNKYSYLAQEPKESASTTAKPMQNFNFIPGNLFPGYDMQSDQQEVSPPEFLRNVPISSGHGSFDPNLVNSVQNLYNPNAISWIRNRDISGINTTLSPNTTDNSVIDSKTNITSKHASSTSSPGSNLQDSITPVLSSSPHSVTYPSETTTKPSEISVLPDSNTGGGFDPDLLNLQQGQTDFVPGQISPAFTGYMNSPYNPSQGQSSGGLQGVYDPSGGFKPSSGNGKVGAAVNFNIAQLLGIGGASNANGSSETGFGQGFNPNAVNSIAGGFSSTYTNDSTSVFGGMGFATGGFDPNKANEGFAGVLDFPTGNVSDNSTNQGSGFGYSGFDPNAANVGFQTAGFGLGVTGPDAGSNAYSAGFDPNKVNMMTGYNPYKAGNNGNTSNNLMDYFLGIVSGNSNGQGGSGGYSSAYIAAYNPNSVNQVSYDPNKYNEAHLHLDPIDMLSHNPGMDKDTLKAAASAFDPDKLNKPNMQQAFSPLAMLLNNPGFDKNVLSSLRYDPYSSTSSVANASQMATGLGNTGQGNTLQAQPQGVFDPIDLMTKLMQSTGTFQPGAVGSNQQSMDPTGMFGYIFANSQSSAGQFSLGSTVKPVATSTLSGPTTIVAPTNIASTPAMSTAPPTSTSTTVASSSRRTFSSKP